MELILPSMPAMAAAIMAVVCGVLVGSTRNLEELLGRVTGQQSRPTVPGATLPPLPVDPRIEVSENRYGRLIVVVD